MKNNKFSNILILVFDLYPFNNNSNLKTAEMHKFILKYFQFKCCQYFLKCNSRIL